jgi:hypothetical protein
MIPFFAKKTFVWTRLEQYLRFPRYVCRHIFRPFSRSIENSVKTRVTRCFTCVKIYPKYRWPNSLSQIWYLIHLEFKTKLTKNRLPNLVTLFRAYLLLVIKPRWMERLTKGFHLLMPRAP